MLKSKNRQKLTALIVAAICIASGTVAALASNNKLNIHTDIDMSEAEAIKLIDSLQKKDMSELINEVNKLHLAEEEEKIMYYYDAIKSKLAKTPSDKISAELLSKSNTDDVKINLMTLCSSENIKLEYDNLLSLLDSNTPPSVKNVFIDLLATEGDKYADSIEKLAETDNDPCIVKALTVLYSMRPEKAEAITNEILSDTKAFSEKHNAALVTKANILSSKPDKADIEAFISVCDSIVNTTSTETEDEKEISVIYALSSVKNTATLSYLLSLENETAINFRSYIVEENRQIIDNIIDSAATSENAALLIQAAPYYVPQAEYISKINEYLNQNAEFFSMHSELKNALEEVTR